MKPGFRLVGWLRRAMSLASLCALVACSSGENATRGITEPIRVRSGQFRQGGLLGSPAGPGVVGVNVQNRAIGQGQAGVRVSGLASAEAEAIAVRFDDVGSGYWVVPVGAPDPQNSGQVAWSLTADFGSDLPIGLRHLLFAATDKSGRAGAAFALEVCTTAPYPDNLNACNAKTKPPAAVLSLVWDTNVDLDLRVVTPDGSVIDSKTFSGAPPGDGGITESQLKKSNVGILDRDSNAGCAIDGLRRENVSFQNQPAAGRYRLYVNLFDACSQASVRFQSILYLAKNLPDGTWRLDEQPSLAVGELVRSQANGGSGPGLFAAEFDLQ